MRKAPALFDKWPAVEPGPDRESVEGSRGRIIRAPDGGGLCCGYLEFVNRSVKPGDVEFGVDARVRPHTCRETRRSTVLQVLYKQQQPDSGTWCLVHRVT